MIVEFFIGIGAAIQGWFLDLFGDEPLPAWVNDVAGIIPDLWARVVGLGAWIPLGLLGAVSASLLLAWSLFWIVKVVRWLWGLTPFSGGS